MRYSANSLHIQYDAEDDFQWPQSFIDGITNRSKAIIYSTGFDWNPSQQFLIKGIYSNAFRHPNIDDFAKVRVKNASISFPNPELKPEKGSNFEIQLEKSWTNLISFPNSYLKLSVAAFHTDLRDAIVRDNFRTPNGQDSIEISGRTYHVQAQVNKDRAKVYGYNLSTLLQITDQWQFTFGISDLKGELIDAEKSKSPQAHINPKVGRVELKYRSKLNTQVGLVLKFNGEKPIDEYALNTSDNAEYATPEGIPSWKTWNVYSSFPLGKQVRLHLAIENIFDLHYRKFSSGISEAGRNFILSLSTKLDA